MNSIRVGRSTNIQDCAVVHVARHSLGKPSPTVIGDNVTIGALTSTRDLPEQLLLLHASFA